MKRSAISNGVERAFAILLGISFAGIALFGFSVASASLGGTHVGCVADMFQELQGKACPVSGSPFSLLSSHLESLQSFVGNSGTVFLALFTLIALAFGISSTRLEPLFHSLIPVRLASTARSYSLAKRIRWTSLHETSPTLAA